MKKLVLMLGALVLFGCGGGGGDPGLTGNNTTVTERSVGYYRGCYRPYSSGRWVTSTTVTSFATYTSVYAPWDTPVVYKQYYDVQGKPSSQCITLHGVVVMVEKELK